MKRKLKILKKRNYIIIYLMFLNTFLCSCAFDISLADCKEQCVKVSLENIKKQNNNQILNATIKNHSSKVITNVGIKITCQNSTHEWDNAIYPTCRKTLSKKIKNKQTGKTEIRSWTVCEPIEINSTFNFSIEVPKEFRLEQCEAIVIRYTNYNTIFE